MDTEGILAGCLIVLLIGLALAVNFLLMPYLLMIVLGALGYKFSYIVCVAFWVVFSAIINKLRPRKVNKEG